MSPAMESTSSVGAELLARARALVPVLRERANEAERLRRIPPETIDELRQLGLLRTLQPAMFGGSELPLDEAVLITATLAEGCGSTGWVQGVYSDHCATLGMFSGEAQQDVWRESPDSLIASGFKPAGKAIPVSGGYRLSGRWPFSSGVDYADWVFLRSMAPVDPGREDSGLCLFLVPRSDYTIIDNWFVMGLSGTGSKDVAIKSEVFVPQHRVLSNDALANGLGPGSEFNGGLLYRLPRMATVPFSLSAPLIGIAQNALHTFVRGMKTRASQDPRVTLQNAVQLRVAKSSAEIDASRALMLQDCREAMEVVQRGGQLTLEQRARNRRDIAYIAYQCTRAVDRLFASAGGSAVYLSNEAQRLFRDIHAAGGHISLSWDVSGSSYGQVIFGIPPARPV